MLEENMSVFDIKINDWYLTHTHMYAAPEQILPKICGKVYGHPKYEDETIITTSYIISVEGDIITTQSGHALSY